MAECFANAKENVFNGNLNCWYHCLFWILLPHKLEDIYNCILCIVTGDLYVQYVKHNQFRYKMLAYLTNTPVPAPLQSTDPNRRLASGL